VAARALWFDRDAPAQARLVDTGAHGDDAAGELVAQDKGRLHHKVADATLPVVVHVGATDPDGGNLNENLVRIGKRNGTFLHL
jgi:hypothetical protein